jgi:diguanylate cyclase (GGDEF)-like protein
MARLLPTATHRFCAVVSCLGLALLAVSLQHGLGAFGTQPLLFGLLALGVLLGELLPLKIPRRGDDEEVTISTTFAYALLLGGGLAPALLAQVGASIVQDLLSGKPLWRLTFNVGQYVFSMCAAALVLGALTSVPHPSGQLFVNADLPGILVAGFALWVVNTGIVGVAVALHRKVPLQTYFRSDLGFSFITGCLLLCLAPVLLSSAQYATGLFPLFFFPIYAVYRAGRHAARSEYQATHDQLTDLPNRGLFRHVVQRQMARPDDARPFAVLLMDLDRFKEINDTLGHHYGDRLLESIGPRIAGCLREHDVLARLGGDEFALLLRNLRAPEDAERIAQRICEMLAEPFTLNDFTVEVEASIGIAWSGGGDADVDDLLRRADVAMYSAKGDNVALRHYDATRDQHSPERLGLVSDLRRGIERSELVLHYQPKLDLRTGETAGVEALVRWEHPTLGLLQPHAFVDLAERTGLIKSLTLKVIDTALAQAAAWQAAGTPLTVAVNVPVRSLLDPAFPGQVAERLTRSGLAPSSIAIEITESTMMVDPDAALAVLSQLGAMGVKMAVDDFGTGYSSLAYLKRLPVSELKIDRAFVMNLLDSRNDEVIVRSTIELGHNLGLRVVAEGVEDEESLQELRRLGCDEAQGYHLSRPVPADKLDRWLARRQTPTPVLRLVERI